MRYFMLAVMALIVAIVYFYTMNDNPGANVPKPTVAYNINYDKNLK